MVLRDGHGGCGGIAAPRARGDGPHRPRHRATRPRCSPRPRGWSRRPLGEPHRADLLPAPAGMVPLPGWLGYQESPAPRARGDGPTVSAANAARAFCSPRPRGWSRLPTTPVHGAVLLPAPAGMVPSTRSSRSRPRSAPRARGDGPDVIGLCSTRGHCSPRPRGWSLAAWPCRRTPPLLPAPAGMVPTPRPAGRRHGAAPRARGDGPRTPGTHDGPGSCSPRPRGWSRHVADELEGMLLLPAPAGMVPLHVVCGRHRRPAPRARGDGPDDAYHEVMRQVLLPAPAGMVPPPRPGHDHQELLPAPAGMVPIGFMAGSWWSSAPRARGDGPTVQEPATNISRCSPRPRGWSLIHLPLQQTVHLLPAPAGMVPLKTAGDRAGRPAPRARGDGPRPDLRGRLLNHCSPRPRGWSRGDLPGAGRGPLLPAPAGMVPSATGP